MTAAEIIRAGRADLSGTEEGISHAGILFEHVFGKKYFEIPDGYPLPESKAVEYFDLIRRRAAGEPLQYILGCWSFMGNDFTVGPGVLIPRSDTECTVRKALEVLSGVSEPVVFDLCAGSGCIGLTIADVRPDAKVICIEKSIQAFHYLQINCEALGSGAALVNEDIFEFDFKPYAGKIDMVICNPPYVTEGEYAGLQKELYYEPKEALVGPEKGLYFYRRICSEFFEYLKPGGAVVLEIGSSQAADIRVFLEKASFRNIEVSQDMNGLDRVISGTR